jgi:hyaluronate lyase
VSSVKAYAANPDVTILSNTEPTSTTPGIQAVKSQILGVVAANIWAKTVGPDNGGTIDSISVSKQCSVIVKETYNTLSVGVADPTQSNTGTITVTLNGRTYLGTPNCDPGVTVRGNNPIILSVDVNGSKGKSFNASFTVAAAPVIASSLNMAGSTGTTFNYQITSDKTDATYEASGLPAGLVCSPSGLISGKPTESGMFFTTLAATSSGRTEYATLTLQISDSLTITSNPSLVALTGNPVAYQITSSALQASYATGSLPPGLLLNGSGLIYGTPTASGTYTTTLYVTNPDGGTGRTTLRIQVGSSLSDLSTPYRATTTWVCPANVTAVQVEAWGGGGAGGSALRTPDTNSIQYGGGGAGGAYARKTNYPVTPGTTYYINVGLGGTNNSSVNDTIVPGGDSWFNSVNSTNLVLVLAKGGAGGESAVGNTSTTRYGIGGTGTTNNSIGDVIYAGGSGATSASSSAGGGGSGAGNSTNGTTATNNFGAAAPLGGGNGGTGQTTSSTIGGNGFGPGGGGGGARASGTLNAGGIGGAGQVVLTVVEIANVPQTAYASWSDNAEVTSESVYKYAFGAADATSAPKEMTSSITPTTLSLTAVVRTDDSKLVITPKSVSSLSGTWSATDPVISVVNAADQTGLGAGLVRKVYSVERGIDSKRFLKLEAVYTP